MSSSASARVAVEGALPNACAVCPWRLSNQGQPHPHGFYDRANIKRLWDGLRTGEAPGMTCHPTDPDMAGRRHRRRPPPRRLCRSTGTERPRA